MADAHVIGALNQDFEDCLKMADEPEGEIRKRLSGKISSCLRLGSLRQVPGEKWRIACPPLIRSGVAKMLVVDTRGARLPVLAELKLQNSIWVLTFFEEQCPVCFGLGVNNDCICDLCFGVGWGCFE